ncbi:MAG: hypothetical protein OHK93_005063 [Ramalina farinacea]|uniref:Uncharacterized protein n=1 Tax=Ramalina farinacea TaxID=258253 RepID=A0AA43U0Y0_9LECA|nr:hypothetical protein [Ramalina farinacea]
MAESTDNVPAHVEGSNEVVASTPSEQHPPARPRARRSWYNRPTNLASPSSPCLRPGQATAPVYPYTPLQVVRPEPGAKRPRKAQAFRNQDVTIQSLDDIVEERQTRIVSEAASVQEGVECYTPDYTPPNASVWEPGFLLGDPTPEAEGSGARDAAQVQSPDTPSKIPAEQDGSPTKSARIISCLLSSPARVSRPRPGQMLITQTCRRWWLTGHNIAKCKRSHKALGKKIGKEKKPPVAEAQDSRTTWKDRTSRLTRVFMARVSKRKNSLP